MKRAEKIERAQKLRAEGLTYQQVADRMGVSKQTIRRWLNPDYAESSRQISRAWKDRNREADRARNREYWATRKGECSSCGGPIRLECDGGVCMACRRDERDRRAVEIETWWAEGLTMKEIAERLGWTVGSLGREMHWMRKAGYLLQYRYTDGKRAGSKFPEQVAA